MFVYPRPGEDFERMLKRFTRGVQTGGILREARRRQAFVPEHERRRLKLMKARQRAAKRERDRQ